MTTVEITLPDDLARDLAATGLLEPSALENILRDQPRAARIADLSKLRNAIRADAEAPMTIDEINAEIEAYRAECRRASGP